VGKKRYYRKGEAYFTSTQKKTDFDQEYETPEEIEQWLAEVIAKNEADEQAFLEEQNQPLGPTFEERVEVKIIEMIDGGILKEGDNYGKI
jgi:hypothetical protein